MWRMMTAEQVQAWLNGYWTPSDVDETDAGILWWDESATIEKALGITPEEIAAWN